MPSAVMLIKYSGNRNVAVRLTDNEDLVKIWCRCETKWRWRPKQMPKAECPECGQKVHVAGDGE